MRKEVQLQQIAKRLRHHVLTMTTRVGSGHPTTCMSMAEIMACLFFHEMRFDVRDPKNQNNDEFILSKGHASPILWAAYAEAGILKEKDLETYRLFGSRLEGHPTPNMPWIKAATGSLGQGLSIGIGLALAIRLQKTDSRVFVVLGDGECAEGSVWEGAALADKYRLSNITAIVDANRLGQSGESLHGHDIGRWVRKFAAFGWNTFVVDGHDIYAIIEAFDNIRRIEGPSVIIARTIKGKGVSFLEDKEGWHGKPLKLEELQRALVELGPIPKLDAKKLIRTAKKKSASMTASRVKLTTDYVLGELVATREAYGKALEKLGMGKKIVALDGDVKNSTFADLFKRSYPDRFFDCYIAEQNMVGMAAGLAARGFVPFASTFAAFLSRAHDQIRMSAISRSNIKLCGSHVGVSIGEDGPSQMGLEDLALFRSTPESIILYPSDAVSAERCTELLAHATGIGYLRTSRPKTPVIYKNSESFAIGKCKIVRKGKSDKTLVIAAGITLHEAIKAAKDLDKSNISITIIDAYSVKPLDETTIRKEAKGKHVIVVEDHYPQGGLGEAVAALGIPIVHLAVKGIPSSGKAEILMEKFQIDAKAIIAAVKKAK